MIVPSRVIIEAALETANYLARAEIATALVQPQRKLINLLQARSNDLAEAEAAAEQFLAYSDEWGAF